MKASVQVSLGEMKYLAGTAGSSPRAEQTRREIMMMVCFIILVFGGFSSRLKAANLFFVKFSFRTFRYLSLLKHQYRVSSNSNSSFWVFEGFSFKLY
jgi:hypothetical protein